MRGVAFESIFSPRLTVSNSYGLLLPKLRSFVQSARFEKVRVRSAAVIPYYDE
jgi:hypothetical protein